MNPIEISIKNFASKLFGKTPYRPRSGVGAMRAAIRIQAHAKQQAERVAPVSPVFAAARANHALKRVRRWQRSNRPLTEAPRHIKTMTREMSISRAA